MFRDRFAGRLYGHERTVRCQPAAESPSSDTDDDDLFLSDDPVCADGIRGLDQKPAFPHHSPEASRLLGLPDSPVIHLAVTTIANRLLALQHQSPLPAEAVRITAFRVASGTALEGMPFELAEAEFLHRLNDPGAPPLPDLGVKHTDWLGEATAAIRESGGDPGPDARRMATRYGWRSAT